MVELLTLRGKCSPLRAKSAHFSGHLPLHPCPASTPCYAGKQSCRFWSGFCFLSIGNFGRVQVRSILSIIGPNVWMAFPDRMPVEHSTQNLASLEMHSSIQVNPNSIRCMSRQIGFVTRTRETSGGKPV